MIDGLVEWFLRNPMTNFLVIFGSSGILAAVFKWGAVWAGRRKIQVRILRENFDLKGEPNVEIMLRFEVTNLGEKQTSLEPFIIVTSLTPKTEKRKFRLSVQESDRQLPPHTPKSFTAKSVVNAVYSFCWYKKYHFKITRGSGSIVRYRNAKNEEIGSWRYWFEYLLFRYFKVVVKTA